MNCPYQEIKVWAIFCVSPVNLSCLDDEQLLDIDGTSVSDS
ncbi:hypothetical protein [Nostoc sp.]